MKRKLAISAVVLVILVAAFGFWATSWWAEGDRTVMDPGTQVVKTEKPTVTEFFIYACSHCYALEGSLRRWREINDDRIDFVRVPVVFFPSWMPMSNNKAMHALARTYYAIAQRDDYEMLHERIFDAIHVEKRSLMTEDEMATFLATLGVDEKDFRSRFNSDEVTQKVEKAAEYVLSSAVRMTPLLVVNDHYRVSISGANYNNTELLSKLDEFVKDSRIAAH